MDLALARTFKDLAKRTEEVAQQTEAVQIKLNQCEEQEQRDIKALELADIQLSDTMEPVASDDLIDAVKVASPSALENIFQRTKEARHHAWVLKEKGEESRQITERTIPIFQGLLASHHGKQRHRYHAQLGYALKDQDEPEWQKARESLDAAIALLEESGRPMSPFYQFNWALCAIELDARATPTGPTLLEMRTAIAEAIRQGSGFWKLKAAILGNERVQSWLERNRLSFDGIGVATGQKWALTSSPA
jgi:hypothetical protein